MDIIDDSNLRSGEYEPASALLSVEDDGEMTPPSRLRRSSRRHWREPNLNITSFVDVLSVLLFFCSRWRRSRSSARTTCAAAANDEFTQDSKLEVKNLSLSLARDGLKLRGLITPENKKPEALDVAMPLTNGVYDLDKLQGELLRIKGSYKTDEAIILMVGDDVHFDWIVKVMDTVRERVVFADGAQQVTTLFPQVSLSDYLIDSQA